MTTIITTDETLTRPVPPAFGAVHAAVEVDRSTRRRARWPLFGVVAGVAGLAGALATISNGVTEEDARLGVDVVDTLERGGYHVAFVLGLVSVAALLVTAAAWRRWAEYRAPRDLAARTIPAALGVTAAVNVLGTALAGSMALYLPGGTDEGWLSKDAIFVNFTLLDFGMLLGWWGVAVAAGAVAVLALRRQRVLPRWMGVVSILFLLPPVALGVGTALPGMPGLTMPVWLSIISIGMFARRESAV